MRVIGIDPGTRHLGWGVLDQTGTKITHVAHGVVSPDEHLPLADRLVHLDEALEHLLDKFRPEAAAVEAIFFAKDAQAAAKLGHARGVILLRLARARLPIHEYPPARVKRAVTGKGAATKDQVALLMTALLGLGTPPKHDAADALANAFTHLAMSKFTAALAASRRS
jgi:crossover junction endodeoxyribonuclease RuvC